MAITFQGLGESIGSWWWILIIIIIIIRIFIFSVYPIAVHWYFSLDWMDATYHSISNAALLTDYQDMEQAKGCSKSLLLLSVHLDNYPLNQVIDQFFNKMGVYEEEDDMHGAMVLCVCVC